MKINGAIKTVQKRSGRIVPFKAEKITLAIFKALRTTGEPDCKLANEITQRVICQVKIDMPCVEDIQDLVELKLFKQNHFKAAKASIVYRKQHNGIRNVNELFFNVDMIDDYINNNYWRIKESVNSTYSLQGMNQHVSTIISSQYWLSEIYSAEGTTY